MSHDHDAPLSRSLFRTPRRLRTIALLAAGVLLAPGVARAADEVTPRDLVVAQVIHDAKQQQERGAASFGSGAAALRNQAAFARELRLEGDDVYAHRWTLPPRSGRPELQVMLRVDLRSKWQGQDRVPLTDDRRPYHAGWDAGRRADRFHETSQSRRRGYTVAKGIYVGVREGVLFVVQVLGRAGSDASADLEPAGRFFDLLVAAAERHGLLGEPLRLTARDGRLAGQEVGPRSLVRHDIDPRRPVPLAFSVRARPRHLKADEPHRVRIRLSPTLRALAYVAGPGVQAIPGGYELESRRAEDPIVLHFDAEAVRKAFPAGPEVRVGRIGISEGSRHIETNVQVASWQPVITQLTLDATAGTHEGVRGGSDDGDADARREAAVEGREALTSTITSIGSLARTWTEVVAPRVAHRAFGQWSTAQQEERTHNGRTAYISEPIPLGWRLADNGQDVLTAMRDPEDEHLAGTWRRGVRIALRRDLLIAEAPTPGVEPPPGEDLGGAFDDILGDPVVDVGPVTWDADARRAAREKYELQEFSLTTHLVDGTAAAPGTAVRWQGQALREPEPMLRWIAASGGDLDQAFPLPDAEGVLPPLYFIPRTSGVYELRVMATLVRKDDRSDERKIDVALRFRIVDDAFRPVRVDWQQQRGR